MDINILGLIACLGLAILVFILDKVTEILLKHKKTQPLPPRQEVYPNGTVND